MTITITFDIKKYCEQLKSLNDRNQEYNPQKDDEVRILLYDISL